MKKLVMGVAIALCGIAANAASMQWGNMFGESYVDINGNDFAGGTAILFVLAGDDATAVTFAEGAWLLNGATQLATSSYDADLEGWGTDAWTDMGAAVSADASQYFQLLILDKEGISSIDGYEGNYVSFVGMGDQEVVDPSGPTYGVNAMTFNDIAAADWQTAGVPEPTSGLLLLLGMAGLALKRKQA